VLNYHEKTALSTLIAYTRYLDHFLVLNDLRVGLLIDSG